MTLSDSLFPLRLREYLQAGECVAFVGAGFSAECGMPTWPELLAKMISEASKCSLSLEQESLLSACNESLMQTQFAQVATGLKSILSHEEVRRFLISIFDSQRLYTVKGSVIRKHQKRMLRRMENLVLSPWAGVITTNFDSLIEQGFDLYSHRQPFRCSGDQSALGSLLCLPAGGTKFLAKLHGESWADVQVLSTEDYVQAWMVSPRIQHFLTAVMLRYRLVFIGCSLEDEILRLRRRLWAEFGRALPQAFALLPNTSANRLRSGELRSAAGIDPLLYAIGDDTPGHEALDLFLAQARQLADVNKRWEDGGLIASIRHKPIPERLAAIGAVNLHLLLLVYRQVPVRRLEYLSVYDPIFDQLIQKDSRYVLSRIGEGERLYRFLFLVATGLLQEVLVRRTAYFILDPTCITELDRVVQSKLLGVTA